MRYDSPIPALDRLRIAPEFRAGIPAMEDYRRKPPAADRIAGGSRPRQYVPGLPVFTILMPVMNRADLLPRALDSIIAQTYPNIEVLIADGNSRDGTVDVLRRYDSSITYWLSEKDRDSIDAINKLSAIATGTYTTMFLSDDWLPPDYFEIAARAFERTGADILYGDLSLYDEKGVLLTHVRGKADYRKSIRYEFSVTSPGWIFRQAMSQEIGLLNSRLDIAPDYEWVLRAHMAGYSGAHEPALLYNFLVSGRSTVQAVRGYRELRQTAIAYGGNPVVAWRRFIFATLRNRSRKLLQALLPEAAVMRIQKMVWARRNRRAQ